MPKKPKTDRLVRRARSEIRPATASDLARLRDAMEEPIDTSEIPESRGAYHRLKRDTQGRLPGRGSIIRDAIKRELELRKMTPYRLWKEAMSYCPTLSQSAVHEFLKGQRQIELPYAEALLAAMNLGVIRQEEPESKDAK
jgi:hypothetical protein